MSVSPSVVDGCVYDVGVFGMVPSWNVLMVSPLALVRSCVWYALTVNPLLALVFTLIVCCAHDDWFDVSVPHGIAVAVVVTDVCVGVFDDSQESSPCVVVVPCEFPVTVRVKTPVMSAVTSIPSTMAM